MTDDRKPDLPYLGDLPDLQAGPYTTELDQWLTEALRFGVREGWQGLPEMRRPDESAEAYRDRSLPWFYAVVNFLWHASTAHLLIRIAQLAPDRVDEIAAELRDVLDAGDFYPEWTWEWANLRHLDITGIQDAIREQLKSQASA